MTRSVLFERGFLAPWRALRAEFGIVMESAYERAETATNGVLLNARGKAAGVDPFSLFKGPEVRARAYASEELLEHWDRFPRITYAEFERQQLVGGEDER